MEQIGWLTRALDNHIEKPAIVICHHNVNQPTQVRHSSEGGLRDGAELVDALLPRKHVKAFILGIRTSGGIGNLMGFILSTSQPQLTF